MKIAVLGGGGFIGHHLDVALCGFRDTGEDIWWTNHDLTTTGEDLTQWPKSWNSIMQDRPDVIINLIARLIDRDTAIVVIRLCSALMAGYKMNWQPHVVHLSSAAVYGDGWPPEAFPLQEDAAGRMGVVDLYGLDKRIGEDYLEFCARQWGSRITILRPTNVYGPGQSGNVIDLIARRLRAGEPPVINTSNDVSRDFVYVGDVVTAIMAVIEKPPEHRLPGQNRARVYNVSSGVRTSLGDLATMMRAMIGGPAHVVDQRQPCGIHTSVLSNDKIRDEIGWCPQTEFETGLRMTLEAEGFLEGESE